MNGISNSKYIAVERHVWHNEWETEQEHENVLTPTTAALTEDPFRHVQLQYLEVTSVVFSSNSTCVSISFPA